jgi:two-component system nitrate/nitrite response regulator NarL
MTQSVVPQAWRVLVVDDHPLVRRGLRDLLRDESWVAEVREADSATTALEAGAEADLVVLDVGLPDGDGIGVARRLLADRPGLPVLMLTIDDDETTVTAALTAGVRGFVLKDSDPEAVLDAIRAVHGGSLILGPRVGGTALTAGPPPPPPPFDRLTARERTTLMHLAAGESNAQIARELWLSEKTVRNGLSAIYLKIGVRDRVGAILLARDAGIGAGEAPAGRDPRP